MSYVWEGSVTSVNGVMRGELQAIYEERLFEALSDSMSFGVGLKFMDWNPTPLYITEIKVESEKLDTTMFGQAIPSYLTIARTIRVTVESR